MRIKDSFRRLARKLRSQYVSTASLAFAQNQRTYATPFCKKNVFYEGNAEKNFKRTPENRNGIDKKKENIYNRYELLFFIRAGIHARREVAI